jgi:hypothetical protein
MTAFSCTFDPDTPANCPPDDAQQGKRTLYRCVKSDTVETEDFVSDVKAKRRNADPENCLSWGCSVWLDEDAVEHALSLFRFFKRKYIVVGDIDATDGAVMNTQSDKQPKHHTFWQATGVDVSSKFSIFMEKGVRV